MTNPGRLPGPISERRGWQSPGVSSRQVSAPSASPAPQSAQVSGNTCTVSSGLSTRGNPAPAAPGCLPRRRSDRLPVFRDGALRPGKSSVDGGIEELSLLRPTSRSSPATRSASRAFAEASSSITTTTTTTSRDAHEAHPGAGGGIADTNHNDQESSAEINTPRRVGPPATGRRQPVSARR